jgi:DNA invertase Pin-like site-specific DNA recombinase
MPKKKFAVALCRVSTAEQKNSNSLNRQEESVLKAATELNVEIVKWWSGNVSSKAGTNVGRKDLVEIEKFCKDNSGIKYLIVDEPDRFMRSIDEAFYFEVLFRGLGVKLWYACDPMLNTDDLNAKMLKFSRYFPAEGGNVERINKSINGQISLLKLGKYPFSPKPGYRRGYEKGIQEIHEVRGPILRKCLLLIIKRQSTPAQALVYLNNSAFTKEHSKYKMDKFRKIVTDPFYAGIIEIDKQVKVRNENGLHEPLITKDQHYELLKIMKNKVKNQSGPRKNGNPYFPLNNIVTCDLCKDIKNGRIVGFKHTNGKPNSKIYEQYRCRSCQRYISRSQLHGEIIKLFNNNSIDTAESEDLIKALKIIWHHKEGETAKEVSRLERKIKELKKSIARQVEALTDPSKAFLEQEILTAINDKKNEIIILEEKLLASRTVHDKQWDDFLKFAFKFVDDLGNKFLGLSTENRLRCKELIFPGGFYWDKNNKVYTPEVSLFYRLKTKKKSTEVLENSHLVRVTGL